LIQVSALVVLQWLIHHGPRMLGIAFVMLALTWLARRSTRRLAALMARGGFRGSIEEREARAHTVVGVFENAATVLILSGGTLMLLQEAGIPIAPLLGGAAILGLAVAFGAQNLMRDFFAGFVILLENQYRINDVVKIGELSGSVERITLRMTVLRDLEGSVHFVPNGQITTVTNLTHGWSRAVFDISVAYQEDVDRVMALLVELGQGLRADPDYSAMILDDPAMLGVDALGETGVTIKFFLKTRPLQQWAVRRELLRRIKNRFDQLGIQIARPRRIADQHAEPAAPGSAAPRPEPNAG
jgi:small-conductance mechanosensitive channel